MTNDGKSLRTGYEQLKFNSDTFRGISISRQRKHYKSNYLSNRYRQQLSAFDRKVAWNAQNVLELSEVLTLPTIRSPQAQGLNSFPTRRNILSKVDVKSTWTLWSLLILILIDIFITGVFSLDLVELCCFTNHCGSYKPESPGKPGVAGWLHEKNLSEYSRNQETQQPNETRAQLVEGECSHH